MLKQLRLGAKLKITRAKLDEIKLRETELKKEEGHLEKSIDETESDEDLQLIDEEIKTLEKKREEIQADLTKVNKEIEELELELEELNQEEVKNPKKETPVIEENTNTRTLKTIGGEIRMKVNKYETRNQILARLDEKEVREFYSNVTLATKEKRSLTGEGLLIPLVVMDMIQTQIGDFSKLYSEVNVVPLNGDARVILDGSIPEGIWTESEGAVSELFTSFSNVEIQDFKVGGFFEVSNSSLEDSFINLANHLESRLAMAIAKAVDKSIINGKKENKEPTGIITVATNKVTSNGTLIDIMGKISLIDDGEDGVPTDEIIAVMKRKTFYKHIAPQTYLPTSDGRLVIQSNKIPMLPDGTRIVFSQYTPDDTIVIGDFKQYLLGQRAGVKISVSTDYKFVEDRTLFKGTARYDGKPVYPNKFVVIKIESVSAFSFSRSSASETLEDEILADENIEDELPKAKKTKKAKGVENTNETVPEEN